MSRLPGLEEVEISQEKEMQIEAEKVITCLTTSWTPLAQGARLRLLHVAGYTPANLAAVVGGLGGPLASLVCKTVEVEGWVRVLMSVSGQRFSHLSITWNRFCSPLAELNIPALIRAAQGAGLKSLTFTLDMCGPPVAGRGYSDWTRGTTR